MNNKRCVIRGTYGKTRDYREMASLPKVGDEWIGAGYEDAKVTEVICVNDEVAETTSGDPKEDHDFYKVIVEYDDDEFTEYVCVER